MRLRPAETARDRLHKHFPLVWYVRHMGTLHLTRMALIIQTACTSDSLAFMVLLSFTARSSQKIPGHKVPTISKTIVENATVYFLVIFTSHLVLEMTLLFGRVSRTIPLFELQPVTTNLCYSRNRSSSSQARKSLPTYLVRNHTHCYFRFYTQRDRRVSPARLAYAL